MKPGEGSLLPGKPSLCWNPARGGGGGTDQGISVGE